MYRGWLLRIGKSDSERFRLYSRPRAVALDIERLLSRAAMSINPYDSPQAPGQLPERKPGMARFWLIRVLAVVGIIGVLIALLLPAVRTSGDAARRMSCGNNLKRIGLALANYESDYHCLPPAYTVDADGKPLHSWRTLILPYLEQQALYEKIDLSKPWDDPANQAAHDARVPTYECPSNVSPAGRTTYLAVIGPDTCLRSEGPRTLADITDDYDLTLVVMEVDPQHAVHWMSPTDATEPMILDFAAAARLPHPEGAQALFVNSQVRFLSKDIKPDTLRALVSIAGNDDRIAEEVR